MKNKILLVLYVLFSLMFINSGLNKIFNYIPIPPDMPEAMKLLTNAMMQIVWLMPLVAVAEIIGGILIIIPKTRALGAIIIFPIMIGITLTHVFSAPSGIPIAIILGAINIWIIIENRKKYLPMIK